MAVVIGTAILTAVGASEAFITGTLVLGLSGAAIVGGVALVGLEIGLSALLKPSAPNFGASKSSQDSAFKQQFATRQPIPSRRRYYGTNKAAGYYAFIQSLDGALYEVILVAAHEIQFLEHWVADRLVTIDGSGNVTAPVEDVNASVPIFHILSKTGAPGQTAHAELITDFPTLWTTDHTLTGIANVLFVQDGVNAKDFSTFYPGGPQAYRAVFNGDRVYDLNSAQNISDRATWNLGHNNAANVIRDYLVHYDGMRLPDEAWLPAVRDWTDAATICGQAVPKAGGGTVPRYSIAGGYDLIDAPKDTLGRLLAACDGYLYMRGDGALSLKVGTWEDPEVTISDEHIRSFQLPKGVGPLRSANEIRASINDPDQDYQPVEVTPWRDEADITTRGEVITRSLDIPFVPNHNQARRLMKITAARSNPERAGTIVTNLYGLNALGQRRIHLTIAKRNIDLDCEVTSFKVDFTNMSCVIGVLAMNSDAYDFDEDTEEGTADTPAVTPSGGTIDAPTSFVAVSSGSRISVSCDAPSRADLQFNVEYSVQGSGVWTGILIAAGATDGLSSVIAPSVYDVRSWFTAPAGSRSDYATVTSVTIGTISAPSSATNLAASVAGATVTVEWTSPNDPNVYACRIWQNSTATFGTATDVSGAIYCGPSQDMSRDISPPSGAWYYWVTAESATGGASSPAGPVSVVV